jgi:site-specific recombinase XerD
MSDHQTVHEAISSIMKSMELQGSTSATLRNYETAFNVFEKYLSDNGISLINKDICLEYVYAKTGMRFDSFNCVTRDRKIDYRMRPLLLLLHYLEDGHFNWGIRSQKSVFICPPDYKPEYESFCEELIYGGYSQATIDSAKSKIRQLIEFLSGKDVPSSAEITISHVESFLETLSDKAVKYVAGYLYVFRKFFTFIYEKGYTSHDLAPMLSKVRTVRNATIPYVWTKADIQKLLEAVDRNDPKGKRDYAILLIAIRLGLRIGDIRKLKQSSIDWNRKTINLVMSKTGQPIELPLLKDIGWAIIDYLQNGRPATDSECLFVRHKAPYNAFGDRNAFGKELHRYIIKAALDLPDGKKHGMHSLRSTLAGNMLEVRSPLPIISEALGHQSVNTTSIYLKIDLEGLRKCALDPEEVFEQ